MENVLFSNIHQQHIVLIFSADQSTFDLFIRIYKSYSFLFFEYVYFESFKVKKKTVL